jgi:hypothetical protein
MEGGTRQITLTFAQLAVNCGSIDQVIDCAIATWCKVDAALSPVIGPGGVAALYRRSLYLRRADFRWLAAVHENALLPDNYTALRSALGKQTDATVVQATGALLQTFVDLLTNLLGDTLTDRLLRPVWDNPSSGDAVQDTSP